MTELTARVQALEALFRHVETTRMAGVPVLNRALRVEAVGFEPVAGEPGEAPAAAGVLLTPWFMNLVWLPLKPEAAEAGVGRTRLRRIGDTAFEFIGGHEAGFGAYEACSLASPMFDFADQAQARATAEAVLDALRPAAPAVPAAPAASAVSQARRGFLFGRPAAGAQS